MANLKIAINNAKLQVSAYDEFTGEVLEIDENLENLAKQLVYKELSKRQEAIRKQIKHLYEDKIMIFQKMLDKARKELNGTELKVFLYMLSVMEFENYLNIPQKEMAKDVGIHITNLKKAIKGLREKGYIEIVKKGRENYYRINPEVAWKGSEKSHLKVLKSKNPLID